ncbi:heavy metal translocating P-type ATPase [Starkeya koreensis]|uniref:P-type Zn(2+) transporter n=1 Tax=Ancylobacter koreensis TaxID=266121 RepID=A0ABT0DK10_9HYPH|nr:heavy metal translocating P-type ATPase [Ancylobacter koreensis]MCK0207622.1 heavy metal translocating P-type ATPase [Ancylobacter koreensis]
MPSAASAGIGRAWTTLRRALLPALVLALAASALAYAAGLPDVAARIWTASTLAILAVLLVTIAGRLRRGEFGLDLIAVLAMAGALAFGESLAGAIVALMFTGGEALEAYARRRAAREMTALLGRLPRSATRREGGHLHEVPLDALLPGDVVLIRRGEVVPVDGRLDSPAAVLDQSALTGEPLPARRARGDEIMSGSTNAGDAFDLVATRAAADSTYAGIVRLVRAAQDSKAPMARLADRFALGFLGVTLALAGLAWAASGEAVRALAVLVTATPCPLILAVPVAIISGISRCARHGVLVKDGGALETLAKVRTVLLDKTGTLTGGQPRLVGIRTRGDMAEDELLRLAASLDQGSAHVVAQALVAAAGERELALEAPEEVHEAPGAGIGGMVGGRQVALGGWDFVAAATGAAPDDTLVGWTLRPGTVAVAVAVDGRLAGALMLADEVRSEARAVLDGLRGAGVRRLVLATGDEDERAHAVADGLGFDAIASELTPADKTAQVIAERGNGPVMMVGDGVNDAPALAAADIGVALAARGSAASSEAANVVILVDRLDRLIDAMRIARRARAVALQSVYVGVGLSLAGMVAAAFGLLTPVEGALLQELIDVAAILNALRALWEPGGGRTGKIR